MKSREALFTAIAVGVLILGYLATKIGVGVTELIIILISIVTTFVVFSIIYDVAKTRSRSGNSR